MSSAAIQLLHRDRIPQSGCLIIPGRLDLDLLIHLEKNLTGRKITWLIEEAASYSPPIRAHLEKSRSGAMFSADDAAPAAAGIQLKPFLDGNGVLIYVPGLTSVRRGTAYHIPTAHLKTLCTFGLPILPLAVDCPRESCLSIERKSSLPSAVISVGKSIPPEKASIAAFQQSLLEANEEAYSSRSLLKGSLATALLAGLKKHGSHHRIIDGADDTEIPFTRILAASIAFSKSIRKETDKPRVAIVLPPAKAASSLISPCSSPVKSQ